MAAPEIMDAAVVEDAFANAEVVPGLEHLGKAIVDERGAPSGSPANYEKLRGWDGLAPVDLQAEVGKIAADPALTLPATE